jgi:hypothetical protein
MTLKRVITCLAPGCGFQTSVPDGYDGTEVHLGHCYDVSSANGFDPYTGKIVFHQTETTQESDPPPEAPREMCEIGRAMWAYGKSTHASAVDDMRRRVIAEMGVK